MLQQFSTKSVQWEADLQELLERIGGRFKRRDMSHHAMEYVTGLLSPVQRNNGWQLAEAVEQPAQYRLQHLLDRAPWNADAVRDDVRACV